jgi:hypothetical protein
MTYDEALVLPADERIEGVVVVGARTPFGGSWILAAGNLTLDEAPTVVEE